MSAASVFAQVDRLNRRQASSSASVHVVRENSDELALTTDVLILGGGPAATWAAISAREQGASVVLVDKGYCGSSGVAATAGVGHWVAAPGSEARHRVMSAKERTGQHLSDRFWVDAVLDTTWERMHDLRAWGWERRSRAKDKAHQPSLVLDASELKGQDPGPFPPPFFRGQSPDYLRFLRGRVVKTGALILDHSPAVELLVDEASGTVAGARGYQRQKGRSFSIRAKAVVLATGGTTWKSKSLGADVNTGDGYLMAAELGATFSSMEFSNFQGMVPFGTSMDKNGFFIQASYWDHRGNPISYQDLHESRIPLLARSMEGTVTAQFTQFKPENYEGVRKNMPNFFMVADKLGIDPFREPFPMDWVHEGTVRGTGGVHLRDTSCSAALPGLYVAGDVAARDRISGAGTGAGGPNLAWAVASGTWSGTNAARFVSGIPDAQHQRAVIGAGVQGTQRTKGHRAADWRHLTRAVQNETLPLEKSVFRSDASLRRIIQNLDDLWDRIRESSPTSAGEEFRTREAAAMVATARLANASALERRETRGMHYRTDYPDLDQNQRRRLLSHGLSDIGVEWDDAVPDSLNQPVIEAGVPT